MRIVHTADVHLRRDRPERMEALEEVVQLAREHRADLVVAGDLFDSEQESQRLGPEVRPLFESVPGRTLLVSGNHDRDAFRPGRDFGMRTTAVGGDEPTVVPGDGCRLIAQPFTDRPFEALAPGLARLARGAEPALLILHCTLDFPDLDPSAFGEEGKRQYLPVSSGVLSELGYRWILAGHFHSRFRVQTLSENSTFIYPGSPSSVTVREEGRRHVGLLDTSTGQMERLPVDSFHYVRVRATFRPGGEAQCLARLEDSLQRHSHSLAHTTLDLSGFTIWEETRLRDKAAGLKEAFGADRMDFQVRGVSHLMDHPLYRKFMAGLEDSVPDQDQARHLEEVFLGILGDHVAAGR